MSKIKETKVYNINDFINWYNDDGLEISPKYQRNPVWNEKAKSYLIDTILRGLPVPQIFIRQIIDVRTKKTKREVIDGQQRLRTIIEFINDEFKVMKSHNEEYGGLYYSQLDEDVQELFLEYELPVEIIKCKEDSLVYDMFARVNTNNMTLNSQELRNAKYWGDFKVFVYNITAKYRGFLIDIKMFNDKQLSRMNDTEFFSSLIIATLDGIKTETGKIIDSYYEKYDESFEQCENVQIKINRIFNVIKKIFNSKEYHITFFYRKVYFYTLYMTLYYLMYGIDVIEIDRPYEYREEQIDSNIDKLVVQIIKFESLLQRSLDGDIYEEKIELELNKFDRNHRSRTTSSAERKERISILCKYITMK